MLRPEKIRHLPRILRLVERALLEPDREGPNRPRLPQLRHHRHHRARIDPPAQKHPQRHIARKSRLHRTPQALRQLRGDLPLGPLPRRKRRRPIWPLRNIAAAGRRIRQVHRKIMPGRQFARRGENRKRRGHIFQRQIRAQRLPIQPAREIRVPRQRFELRSHRQLPPQHRVIQRLLAHSIARAKQTRPRRVVEAERKHSIEPAQALFAHLFIQMGHGFGIRTRAKPMSPALEFAAKFAIIVDFAVKGDRHRAVFVAHRLPSPFQIDHAQPPMPQTRRKRAGRPHLPRFVRR
ncbi:MAG: hypothetical protein BWZ10_00922 [candidate division BRC1 bacterium ADurb.BinA364]|nr:MAG: hypothetical protein BWZ10_00922 [candidate division BRC1 bacterium ADurb.BinA364]